jgi:hypothetical protein
MGIGAGFVLLGVLMWAQAADVQGQIDDKPEPITPADFQALQDLEKQGRHIASAGNVMFIAARRARRCRRLTTTGRPARPRTRSPPASRRRCFPAAPACTLPLERQ